MENVYGFTTNIWDSYLDRVVDEASPETNFIVTTERNTVEDNGENWALVAIRKEALLEAATIIPYETLCGEYLTDLLVDTIASDIEKFSNGETTTVRGDDWAFLRGHGTDEDVAAKVEAVRHEIRRIDNVLNGRIIRVTVESF